MIRVADLHKSYGDIPVLTGLSLEVRPGEIYGLVGKNGAGKTTALNIIAGLRSRDGGEVEVFGTPVARGTPLRGLCGYLPDDPSFYRYQNAAEYLSMLGCVAGMTAADTAARTEELLRTAGLFEQRRKRIGQYSRGMLQRLGLAAAIFARPKALLLDEPSSALDPSGRSDIAKLLCSLRGEGLAVILSSHILSDLETVCDRVGFLHGGRTAVEGRVDDLLRQYAPGGVEITFDCPPEPAEISAFEAAAGCPAAVSDNRLFLSAESSEVLSRVYDAAAKLPRPPAGITSRTATLDAVFERVVG